MHRFEIFLNKFKKIYIYTEECALKKKKKKEEEEEEDSTVDKGKIDFYHGEGRVKRREDEVSEL